MESPLFGGLLNHAAANLISKYAPSLSGPAGHKSDSKYSWQLVRVLAMQFI